MFDTDRKSTGSHYTTTVALLVMAFIFSPALLVVSRPLGFVSVTLALAFSMLCVAFAWGNWRKHSPVPIPARNSGAHRGGRTEGVLRRMHAPRLHRPISGRDKKHLVRLP